MSVGFVQSVGDLNSVLESLFERQGTFLQSIGKGVSFDVLHDHVVNAVLAADIVERTDVWMVQAGDGTGFSLETLP